MSSPTPRAVLRGRVLDLSRAARRIGIHVEDRLHLLTGAAALLEGIRAGDLVEFTLAGPERLATLRRVGGPAGGAPDGASAAGASGDALRWRRPAQAPSRMRLLRLRHQVVRALREHFDRQDFTEVETPALARAPSPEPHFTPLAAGPDFLITSPEFHLKRLLVGGFEKIYRLGPVFRGGEIGRHHNPEFTLLEWYRAGADSRALAEDLAAVLRRVAPLGAALAAELPAPARPAPEAPPGALPQATMAELFRRHLGLDLRGITRGADLRAAALAAGVPGAERLSEDFERAFSTLWVEIEPRFGPEPFLVTDWPAPLASLARLKPGDPALAERMELYAGGLELANGFAELTDPAEQRERFRANLAQRRERGLPAVPLDEAFLAALEEGLPPCAGMALGVDRLVMWVAGVDDIRRVLPFAHDER
jgi:lysyl-tRNA synthetase class 2